MTEEEIAVLILAGYERCNWWKHYVGGVFYTPCPQCNNANYIPKEQNGRWENGPQKRGHKWRPLSDENMWNGARQTSEKLASIKQREKAGDFLHKYGASLEAIENHVLRQEMKTDLYLGLAALSEQMTPENGTHNRVSGSGHPRKATKKRQRGR